MVAANWAGTFLQTGDDMDSSSNRTPRVLVVATIGLAMTLSAGRADAQATDPCAEPDNWIVAENCKPGSPATEWDINGAGDLTIQGFSTDISYNFGETAQFKIDTDSADYRIDIYRMGYYGGAGARKVATVRPSASLPQSQPPCAIDWSVRLYDCGTWAVSASWPVPEDAVSGVYVAASCERTAKTPGAWTTVVPEVMPQRRRLTPTGRSGWGDCGTRSTSPERATSCLSCGMIRVDLTS